MHINKRIAGTLLLAMILPTIAQYLRSMSNDSTYLLLLDANTLKGIYIVFSITVATFQGGPLAKKVINALDNVLQGGCPGVQRVGHVEYSNTLLTPDFFDRTTNDDDPYSCASFLTGTIYGNNTVGITSTAEKAYECVMKLVNSACGSDDTGSPLRTLWIILGIAALCMVGGCCACKGNRR